MSHRLYHTIRQRCAPILRLANWIIAISLVIGSTPLVFAQSENAASIFLPVVSQSAAVQAADSSGQKCYIGTNNPAQVGAQQTWTVNSAARTVTIRTTLAKTFVDNTYGTGSIGWGNKGHKFNDLVGSDNLQLALNDASGVKKLEFKIDYISSSNGAPSGYDSLGVTGGEGKMVLGNAAQVLSAATSIDANFNQFGYVLTTNSPATDANYTPNAQYPNWIYDVWYEVVVSLDAFGAAGFGSPQITGVHASPSKTGNNSESVSETPCATPPTPTPTPGGPTPTPTTPPPTTTGQKCYIGTNNPTQVGAQHTWTVNPSARTVTIRTTLAKTFVDNTYGSGVVGWPKDHKFGDLVGSDNLQLALLDASGVKRMEFKIDYISSSNGAPSGYDTLGVTGGEGKMIVGNASQVLNAATSLDVNFNQFGYVLTTNSPATNASYAPNSQYPNWIYDVWYEVVVSLDAFGAAGFGSADITGVHASPSKTGNNSEPVSPTPCPTPPTPTPTPTNTPAPLGSLGDRVWNDFNRNGVQESGEPGVPNVTVQLKDCSGNVLQTTTTDANGIYRFTNLPAGCYSVGVVLPSGFQFSPQDQGGNDNTDSDVNPGTAMTGPVNLGGGQNIDNVDAGINQPPANTASLGDRVWNDLNRNGIQDNGEPGVDGIQVELLDCNRNRVATTTTAGGGLYGFTNLNPGCYIVRFVNVNSNNFNFTVGDQGTNDTLDSDVVRLDSVTPGTVNGETDPINLAAGQNNPTIDAGLVQPTVNTASLGDRVWNDINRNGVQDGGEPGVPNVTVTLLSGCSGNTVVTTATTNASGNYTFSGLAAGQYRVQMSNLPAGFVFSPQNQGGNDATDSDVNTTTGTSDCITLAAGQNDPNWDAGINQPPVVGNNCIGDFVWNDVNRNGIQDAGESGVAGATINVENTGGTVIASATTDANGAYRICNLPTNITLFIQLIPPAGYSITPENDAGTNDALDSDFSPLNGFTGTFVLPPGTDNLTIDGGLVQSTVNTASLGDRVWNDTNRNGVQDGGEPGVPNVTVTLLSGCSGNTVVTTTTTNASGNYTFSGLAAGQYRVQMSNLPAGFVFSPQNQGGNDTSDSDVNLTTGISDCITLAAGQNDPNWDAGINQPAPNLGSIGDRVWNDLDRDGVQDGGESGVADVTVQLKDCNGNVLQTIQTDGNGIYRFAGLAAGCYSIGVVLPGGFQFSPQDNAGNDNSDSDINPSTAMTAPVNLGAGQNIDNVDAGINQPPVAGNNCIGDRVWSDTNRNGIQDNGEVGVAGATINVENTGGTIIGSAVTDANGNYQICNLPTNTTLFTQLLPPAGYLITDENEGNDDTVDSDFSSLNGYTGGITVPPGQNNFTIDGGLVPATASVGDRVWADDATPNGIQDPGDPGLPGSTVKLFSSNGNTLATQTTDSNGNYLFTNLPAGTYYLCFTPPAPPPVYIAVPQDQGGDDTLDSDMSQSNNCTAPFSLSTGANLTLDAGFVDP